MASERLERALDIKPFIEEIEAPEVVEEVADDPKSHYWVCPGCSENESIVLEALQDEGITDRTALAVLMGNIMQESKFQTKICEGGKLTGYHGCHRGGFGLVQWTTKSRYSGLGRVASQYNMDPNTIEAQLKWLFTEREWKLVEHRFKTPDQSVSYYMDAAFDWLRWGVHGKRTLYSYKYFDHLKVNS